MAPIIPNNKSSTFARVFLFFFGAPFVVGGSFAFYAMMQNLEKPTWAAKDVFIPGIMGVAFVGVGLLMWWAGLFGAKKITEQEKLQASAPEQPWMWRDDWAQGRVNSHTKKAQAGIWFFAIFWNLVSSPVLFFIPEEARRNPVALIGLLFPIIGVGMLVWAARTTMRARRFGATYLEMSPLPAVPGGRVGGTIHARVSTPPAQGVMLRLTCLGRTTSSHGKDRSTSETILWREERSLTANEVMLAGGEASIPVRFALPADALVTTVTSEQEDGIFWSLTADASLDGIDYQDDFEIPVFKTGAAPPPDTYDDPRADVYADSAQAVPVFASDRAPQVAEVSLADLARAGITVSSAVDGAEYRFAAARNQSFALGVTFFTAIWTGALWLQFHFGFPWIFRMVTGLFELLLVAMVSDLWLGVTTLTVGGGAVRRLHTVLGLGWRRAIPYENISKIDLHINMQTSGRQGTPYYALRATFIYGRHRTLASGIRDKRHAEWLAAELCRAIGLPIK